MADFLHISYTLTGGLAPYGPAIERHCAAVVAAHAAELQAAILQEFEASKSGRAYPLPDGGTYTASAPGEAPAIRSRELYASVQVAPVSDLARVVYTDDDKADILEYGLGRAAARPFFHPAVEAQRAAFVADMARLEDSLRTVRGAR